MITFHDREIESEDQLFGRKKDLQQLEELINKKSSLIIITGLRRVGKSSLLRCIQKKYDNSVFINAWNMGAVSSPNREQILDLFRVHIQEFFVKHKNKKEQLKEFLQSITELGFDLPYGGGHITFKDKNISESTIISIFHSLNNWAENQNKSVLLIIDEVQDLAYADGIDLRKILSSLLTNKNLIIILTGSEIGTFQNFMKDNDADASFFGRYPHVIHIGPFSRNESSEFLLTAFANEKIGISRTIPSDPIVERAINELGGIVGWLAYFGLDCVAKQKISEESLNKTKEYATKLVEKEFKHFIESNGNDSNYEIIMTELAKLSKYNFVEFIKKFGLHEHLEKLIRSDFIRKESDEEVYNFSDPLVTYSFEKKVNLVEKNEENVVKKSKTEQGKKRKSEK